MPDEERYQDLPCFRPSNGEEFCFTFATSPSVQPYGCGLDYPKGSNSCKFNVFYRMGGDDGMTDWEYVELEATSDNAAMIDYAYLDSFYYEQCWYGKCLSRTHTLFKWGLDDNYGWCMSTNADDWKEFKGKDCVRRDFLGWFCLEYKEVYWTTSKTCRKKYRFKRDGFVYPVFEIEEEEVEVIEYVKVHEKDVVGARSDESDVVDS